MSIESNFQKNLETIKNKHQMPLSVEKEYLLRKESVDMKSQSIVDRALRDADNALQQRRRQLINSLFDAIENQLYDFVETKEYQQILVSSMKKIYDKDRQAIFYVCSRDMYLEDLLRKDMPLLDLSESDTPFIGGFHVIFQKATPKDFSIDSLLEKKKLYFDDLLIENLLGN